LNNQLGRGVALARGAARLDLPVLEHVELRDFSLYQNRQLIELDFDRDVFCLAGANGLGKSTFLAAVNFGLTGIVADPTRKFDSVEEYYKYSIPYSQNFFAGRIDERDRETAEIGLRFRVGSLTYATRRGMFESQSLRFVEVASDGSLVLEDSAFDDDFSRHEAFSKHLTESIGLHSFEQFVFLQHFLFTFDERRRLLFWDEKITEQVLYLAFGVDAEQSRNADQWRRQAERADSQARNLQYQATAAEQRLRDLERRSAASADADDQLTTRHDELITERDERVAILERLAADRDAARMHLARLSAESVATRKAYEDEFNRRLTARPDPRHHPIVALSLSRERCEVCGTSGEDVVGKINEALADETCPLCGSATHREAVDSAAFGRLAELDAQLVATDSAVDDARATLDRLETDVALAEAELGVVSEDLATFERDNEAVAFSTSGGTATLAQLADQYRAEIADALRRKNDWRRKRDEYRSRLAEVQRVLSAVYAEAENEFVPRFTNLAQSFLGLELEIYLNTKRSTGVELVLTIEGTERRALDQLSESQRYFLDIALRMALAQNMTKESTPPTLYIDTPEGSLDIAYEARAGQMFGEFVLQNARIVMTANINTSQLLVRLAEVCGSAHMGLVRMTGWTTLSDVQIESEGLFDTAYEAIEAALNPA
jgi:hypothetical protein